MRRYGWLVSFGLLGGCGGELIRLGDGPLAGSSTSGAGGSAGSALAGSSSGGGTTSMLAAGEAGVGGETDTCASGQVLSSEVVWIGDSWVIRPGTQHTRVTELARLAGTLATNEDYSFDLPKEGADMAAIAKQYEARQAGTTKIKVLLMDGGTWDPIIANLTGMSVSDAIDTSVRNFRSFLAQVASDGTVEHIVYFLVPELPTIPGVAEMRPELQQACAESAVPCHFLDLETLWQQRRDDEPSYTADDGIQASSKGGTVIGEAIWKIMQDECIAQ